MHVLRRWLMVALVVILPVQGVAAAFAPLHQAAGQQSASEVPCHGHHAESQDSQNLGSGNTNGGNTESDAASHLCCHQVFSGVPTTAIITAAQKINDTPQTVPLLHSLFVPDSLYRPPRG